MQTRFTYAMNLPLPATFLSRPAALHRRLAAWLLLGLFLACGYATMARAATSAEASFAPIGAAAHVCAVADLDPEDSGDLDTLPVRHAMAGERPLPQRFEIAIVLEVSGVQPGLPPPRPAS